MYVRAAAAPVLDGACVRHPRSSSLRLRALTACLLALAAAAAILARTATEPAPAAGGAHRLGARGLMLALPATARGAVSTALGAAGGAYTVTASRSGLQAQNAGQGLRAHFGGGGARIVSGGTHVGVSLRAAGYGSALERVAAVAPEASANRVTYAHPGLTEWYSNGPLGLEQGFTIARPLPGRRQGPLTLALALSGGARTELSGGGQSLTVGAARGPALRYGGLAVTDARGRLLRSWLELDGGLLLVRVDARGARYPLRVDPIWTQQSKKLTAAEEVGEGEAGWSVALSSDGNTALIGGWAASADSGAVWVFTRSGEAWSQQGKPLTGGEESGAGSFGWSVALSSDGNTALIGGPADASGKGAAWVFTRTGSAWAQQGVKLTGGEEVGEGEFGYSVALSSDGDTALIGGPRDNSGEGSVWVFTRSAEAWSQQGKKLDGTGAVSAPSFGSSVAISGEGSTAVIGGPRDDSNKGSVWVFTRSGEAWSQQGEKLTGTEENGTVRFGSSVAVSGEGDTALIGGPDNNSERGAAWVFTRSGETWKPQGKKLTGGEEIGIPLFGTSVALSSSGNTAIVGGFHERASRGAAWIFDRVGSTWSQLGKKLTGEEESGEGDFGYSVALSSDGETAMIGGPADGSGVGAAWAFTYASLPPRVLTGTPSAGQTSAIVSGTVNPESGVVSSCEFEYGSTESYGHTVKCEPALPYEGDEPVHVKATVSGLEPDRTYDVRLVAANEFGPEHGINEAFKTTSPTLPEVGRCVKQAPATGKYKSSSCTTKSAGEDSGKYEWQPWPAANDRFSFTSGEAKLQTASGTEVTCRKNTLTGEYGGSQAASASLRFQECEASGALSGACQSEDASAGEILTNALEARLGEIKLGATPTIGWDLKPALGPYLMTFACGATEVSVAGSVIGQVTRVDKMSASFAFKFKAKQHKQVPERFEGGAADTLSFKLPSGEEAAALTMTDTIDNGEELEIKAVA